MKKIFILTIALCIGFTICTQAQEQEQQPQESGFFKHLDASVNLGTTGVGVDVSSPMGEYFQLRGGISIMPQFHYKMNFRFLYCYY